ncbi:MATE family efflux transporter [Eubacteriales bacterium OttesenSCG-928-M02]|nr:MATE family efflux transporter [Eubacteriales bacterium OttesenSCG-928-M02]
MTRDMSTGKPAKVLFAFAWPMLLGNIFQQFYNMVDSIVVGNYVGSNALAAVGTAFPVMMLLTSVVMGLTSGFSVVISQYFGAGRTEEVRNSVFTAIAFLLMVSAALSVVGLFIARPVLVAMRTPQEILPDAVTYLMIIFGGMIFSFMYNGFSAVLRALGDSKTPLYMLILSTIVNIILDLVFVVVFHWDVAGVAIATIIAQAISALTCFVYTMKRVPMLRFSKKNPAKFDRDILKTMVRLGIPSAVQQSVFSIGMLFVQSLVNSFGSTVIAGYTSGTKIDSFVMMPMMNVGNALATYTAQNLGAGKPERIKEGYRAALIFNVIFCLALTAIVFSFGPQLVGLFVDSEADAAVIKVGTEFLDVICIFYILMGLMNVGSGILRGAGDMKVVMMGSFTNLGARLLAAYTLAPLIGEAAIWWSMPIGWGMAVLIYNGRYFSGKWKEKAVVTRREEEEASLAADPMEVG